MKTYETKVAIAGPGHCGKTSVAAGFLRAIYDDIHRIEKEQGWELVSLAPKRISKPAEPVAR